MDGFYIAAKILWFLASPDHFLLLLTLLSAVLIARQSKWGMRLLCSSLCVSFIVLFLPIADVLLRPLEKRFPIPSPLPDKVAGVIVLGGSERADLSLHWQQAQFNQAAERMMAIPVLAKRYPQAEIVFSGGSGSLLHSKDIATQSTYQWFVDQGVAERVVWEKKSRNTHENAVLSEKLLKGVPKGSWLLVTSAFHMPRSIGVFRARGWDVIAYPVDFNSKTSDGLRLDPKYWMHVRDLNFTLKEWIGLVVYYLSGKSDVLFPAP